VIRVAGGRASGLSSGRYVVNAAPEFHLTEPDRRGDETRDYAADVLGNPWGPMDSADIVTGNAAQTNLQSIAHLGGELVADAPDGGESPGDPRMTFETPTPIDTATYRMLSFEHRLEIVPDQIGSVARIHWGTSTGVDPTPDTVTDDIRLRRGFNTYVLGDMNEVPDRDGVPGRWTGDATVLRFDPHEVDATREIVFRSMRLRPLDTADPTFDIRWDGSDADVSDPVTVSLYRDDDADPDSGNEVLISGDIDGEAASAYTWDATGVPPGEYRLFAVVSDGRNMLTRGAPGKIIVVGPVPDLIFANGFE
jgi:hypothetical protein